MRLSLAFWKHAHNIHSRDAQKKNVVNIVDILGYQGDHDKMARTKTLTEQHKNTQNTKTQHTLRKNSHQMINKISNTTVQCTLPTVKL